MLFPSERLKGRRKAVSDKQSGRGKQPRGRNRNFKGAKKKKGNRFLQVKVRVRCSRGSKKEAIRSQRAGDSRAQSAMKRKGGEMASEGCLLPSSHLPVLHTRLSHFTYFLLSALIIIAELPDVVLVFFHHLSRPPLLSCETPLAIMSLNAHLLFRTSKLTRGVRIRLCRN